VPDKPLVSALLNTYNYARYLPMAINSVLNQTYENIEIVVVDDGSTDETPQVLTQYADRVRAIRVENGGQANAFNVGIPACRGELVMLLDADDQWLPTKVERMVAFARRHPKAGMLYHRFVNIDVHGFVRDWPQPGSLLNGDCRAHYLRTAGSYWGTITSTMVMRPDMAGRILPIPSYGVREGADSVLADCSVLLGEVAGSPEVLAHRRLHGSNFYAAGREWMTRSAQVREQDVRRVEWRMEIIRQIMARLGVPFDVDIERNEWRAINQYLLGKRSFFRMAYNSLTGGTPGESFMTRYKRVLLWADTRARERRESGA
jgi:glycosyltransferase involved in cell wall biosynthesis